MKRIIAAVVVVSLGAGSLAGAASWARRSSAPQHGAHASAVYVCPMHPDYHSDHPGECPICGMHLEPKRGGGDAAAHTLPQGAVQVSPERQQAIGIRLGFVGRLAGTRVLRTTGRVAPDENRTYPIMAAVSGWIRHVEGVTTGDAVKADQVLASFSAPQPEFDSAQQMYYNGLEMLYRASAQPVSEKWIFIRPTRKSQFGKRALSRRTRPLRSRGRSA